MENKLFISLQLDTTAPPLSIRLGSVAAWNTLAFSMTLGQYSMRMQHTKYYVPMTPDTRPSRFCTRIRTWWFGNILIIKTRLRNG